MRRKVLVTGGAGYIGSHTVVELYLSGYMPIIVDNLCNTSERNITGIQQILKTDIPFYKIDCTDLNAMENVFEIYNDIYACVHFVAYKSVGESVENPQKYYKNNIDSLEVLLKCLDNNRFKNLIFSSSCTVYGMPDKLPVDELASFKKAESPYGETKQKCEILINKNLCNSISLRYFNPIGSHDSGLIGDYSRDNPNNLVPIVTEVASGIRDKLIVNGNDYNTHDGTCVRDYIHVQDLAVAHVKALDYLLENKIKDFFNVGTGDGLSVLDIVNAFQEANNLKVNYIIGPRRSGDVEKIYSDGNKIKNILGWEAHKTTKEALVSAWNWQISKNTQIIKNKNIQDWFVLYTKSRQELKVLERLNQLGIQAYTPTKIEVKSWSDRKKKVETCLLPCMVLVRLPKNEVNKVFDVPGVKRYLFVNGIRAVVYDSEVIAMKNYLENKFEVDGQSKIEIGKTIDIPLLKQEGEIIAIEAKKCIVRLKMLGATMSFQLN